VFEKPLKATSGVKMAKTQGTSMTSYAVNAIGMGLEIHNTTAGKRIARTPCPSDVIPGMITVER
jgi:hypothetical protein